MALSTDQMTKLKALRTAIVEAHGALPGNRAMALLHGFADRLLVSERGKMSDDQYSTLGGGTPKTEPE